VSILLVGGLGYFCKNKDFKIVLVAISYRARGSVSEFIEVTKLNTNAYRRHRQ
jgi:hypothetical protein